VWELTLAERAAVHAHAPALRAQARELANGFAPGTADDLRAHLLALTGSSDIAEAGVLRWREARTEAGQDAR
jgi:hypothetical protein